LNVAHPGFADGLPHVAPGLGRADRLPKIVYDDQAHNFKFPIIWGKLLFPAPTALTGKDIPTGCNLHLFNHPLRNRIQQKIDQIMVHFPRRVVLYPMRGLGEEDQISLVTIIHIINVQTLTPM